MGFMVLGFRGVGSFRKLLSCRVSITPIHNLIGFPLPSKPYTSLNLQTRNITASVEDPL